MEYLIWSADEIISNPYSIYVCQSDASGTDGFGHIHGYLNTGTITYTSKQWTHIRDTQNNSHSDELYALLDFLESTTVSKCILVWITDSQSAAYSINKGSCESEIGFLNLRKILEICDTNKLSIIALWVPRESNLLADYLSHLSYYMNRDTVSGEL
jgi:hypothetical protein